MIKRYLLFFALLLSACSAAAPVQYTVTQSPVTLLKSTEPASENNNEASSEKAVPEGYYLHAEFRWVDNRTGTDILYVYEAAFAVLADGQLKAAGDPAGIGEGQAGIQFDDCVEVKPVKMEFSYELQGRKMDVTIDDLDTLILMSDPSLVDGDRIAVFDLALMTPNLTSFELEPFTECVDGLDMEFAQSILTFWLTVIPDLESEYRLIPVEDGTYCTEPISFIEEGLGELRPCYSIRKQ
ncbi:MAG: hypothetical protein MUP11_06345 [Anaerolineales bacterium]|nr:hypothetical protein [Anaerolineales bacterium]